MLQPDIVGTVQRWTFENISDAEIELPGYVRAGPRSGKIDILAIKVDVFCCM